MAQFTIIRMGKEKVGSVSTGCVWGSSSRCLASTLDSVTTLVGKRVRLRWFDEIWRCVEVLIQMREAEMQGVYRREKV